MIQRSTPRIASASERSVNSRDHDSVTPMRGALSIGRTTASARTNAQMSPTVKQPNASAVPCPPVRATPVQRMATIAARSCGRGSVA